MAVQEIVRGVRFACILCWERALEVRLPDSHVFLYSVRDRGGATMSNNMAKIADARKTVEQLKLEVNIDRMMVRQENT